MKPITVVGAGFSGLVTAYLLSKAGRAVRVVEKSSRAGGLIRTIKTEHGLIEAAANGILNSARVEAICADIGVPLLPARREARKRFIYRGRPRQIPLSPFEALRVTARVTAHAARLRPSARNDLRLGQTRTRKRSDGISAGARTGWHLRRRS